MGRLQGNQGTDLSSILRDLNVELELTSGQPVQVEEEPAIQLSDLIEGFKKMKIDSKKWTANTLRNHETKISFILQVLGNRQVNFITVTDMRKLAKLLDLLPPGFARMKAFADISKLSPSDLEGKHKDTLDVTTRGVILRLQLQRLRKIQRAPSST
jgi:hypothetical protein